MAIATSILKFLTKENPEIKHEKVKEKDSINRGSNTRGSYYGPKQLVKWTEFSFDTLGNMYDGNLMAAAEQERASLLYYPYLSPSTDTTVQCEASTIHVLTKWSHPIVQPALDAVDGSFNACRWRPYAGEKGSAPKPRITPAYDDEDSSPVPTSSVQSGTTRRSGRPAKRFLPDAGTTLICRTHGAACPSSSVERLPKEYKSASNWRSSDVTDNEQLIDDKGTLADGASRKNILQPVRQAYTYCAERQCRYGCILTTGEAFIFRIKPRNDRTRGDLSVSLRYDGMMEYVSIPWVQSGHNTLTFNLALWFVHILAGNRHEVAWNYDKLVEEELVTDVCKLAPNLPATPQTEPRRENAKTTQNATSPLRDISRKRKRSRDGDTISFSFNANFPFIPEEISQRSQDSEETNHTERLEYCLQPQTNTQESTDNSNKVDANLQEGRDLKRRRSERKLRRYQDSSPPP